MREHARLSVLTRRLVAFVGAIALLGAACAPGASPAPTSGSSPAPAGGGQAAQNKPASGEPIKVGYVWGVTGAVAEIVRPASEATKAFWDDLNKNGGIKGRPVQMVEIDSKYQVPLAQEGYKKVSTEDKVPLVLLASTGDTEALAQQINADKVVAITFSCDESGRCPTRTRTSSPSAPPTRTR